MELNSESVFNALPRHDARHYWVAYSGGLDSHVLLHVMHSLAARLPDSALAAVHIHHGLQPDAEHWVQHCLRVCAALGVPCQVRRVQARPAPGQSPEEAARAARYAALKELVGSDQCLLTAHHQDDQAETVLLQLLRGCGPQGLAGMPACGAFGAGMLARPLLGHTRAELRAYAERHALHWVEDASNTETGFARNYLRHDILPRLSARWPAATQTLARAAGHCADAAQLLSTLAVQDLAKLRGPVPSTLLVARLRELDELHQDNALRAWIRLLGLPTPSTAHLQCVRQEILPAAADATPCVQWPGAELRRYRDLLYALPPLPVHDSHRVLEWNPCQPLALPDGAGRLHITNTTGSGLDLELRSRRLSVRYRQGGEHCRPLGRGHTHALKKLFQEAGVPPWQRARIPLLFVDDELAAVVGLWICEPFAARPGQSGWLIEWLE